MMNGMEVPETGKHNELFCTNQCSLTHAEIQEYHYC